MHQTFYSKYKITENKPMMTDFMEHQVAYQYKCNCVALIMHSYTNWSEIEADLLWWARTMTSPCIWSPALKNQHIITYLQGSGLKYTVFSFNFSGIFKINDSKYVFDVFDHNATNKRTKQKPFIESWFLQIIRLKDWLLIITERFPAIKKPYSR